MGESSAARLAKADKNKDKEMLLDVFNKFDADGNGSISSGELRKVFQNIGLKGDQVKALFTEIDANKDGEVSFKELVNWLFGTADEALEAKKWIYRTESPKEAMSEFMASINEIIANPNNEAGDLKAIFEAIDASGNKTVNMTEFVAGVKTLGMRMDNDMVQKLFQMIDTERKKVTKPKAPKVKEGWDDQYTAAGVDASKVGVEADAYALAGMPNLSGNKTYYTGNDASKQGKLVHTAYGEYEEVIEKTDRKTGKKTIVRRKVNEGGVPDKLITFKEFEQAFRAAFGDQ